MMLLRTIVIHPIALGHKLWDVTSHNAIEIGIRWLTLSHNEPSILLKTFRFYVGEVNVKLDDRSDCFFKLRSELSNFKLQTFHYKIHSSLNWLQGNRSTTTTVMKFQIFVLQTTLHCYLDYFLYRREPNPKMRLKMLVTSALVLIFESAMKVLP